MIYFIEDVTSQAIKIGIADDPDKRMAMLQIGNPNPLTLLGVIPGGREDEAALHRLSRPFHIRGEWFRTDVLLMDLIRALLGIWPVSSASEEAIDRAIEAIPADPQVAEDLGRQSFTSAIDKVVSALGEAADGLSRTEIHIRVFSRNKRSEDLDEVLDHLLSSGRVRRVMQPTNGRPAERWHHVEEANGG